MLVGAVATCWLYFTNQIGLYIHPRYFTFNIIASLLGLVLFVQAIGLRKPEKQSVPTRRAINSAAVIGVAVFALLIVPPSFLSSSMANQRGMNSGVDIDSLPSLSTVGVISPFGDNGTEQLTVRDWAGLLSQTNDQSFFTGKAAKVSGFITADPEREDVFFVSRFVVSCCTVDARPIGVPVHFSGWQASHTIDQWVEVRGVFDAHDNAIVVKPESITQIDKPKEPYVY